VVPPDYLTTSTVVDGASLLALGALGGFVGFSFVVRAVSRLFAAANGRS
jgi:hypothetical protein